MPISSIYNKYNVTYDPEWGRCAIPKDNPESKVSIRWGSQFEEKLKTTLSQISVEQTEAARNSPPRVELTEDDIKKLVDKYEPSSMTQEEYDSFLDELVEKGVLTCQEIKYMGYKGLVYLDLSNNRPIKDTPVQIDFSDSLAQKWLYGGYSLSGGVFRFDDESDDEIDLVLSAKLHDLFTSPEVKNAYSYYGAMYDVVRRMDSIRA